MVKFFWFIGELFLIAMILTMKKLESIAVLLIMNTLLIQMGYSLQVKPYESKLRFAQEIFNLLTQLYLSYLMLLFTDFVEFEIQNSAGN